ncbi:MAG: GNAT family protein [Proteocatella sp.]
MIETKRLFMVEAKESDIESIMEMENHKENRDFIWQGTYQQHLEEIKDGNHLLLRFNKKENGEMIGYALVGLDLKSEKFELRRIAVSQKGMGYGKEAMKALIKFAFEEKNINRFWLDVYPDNKVGIRLYEGLGLKRDGVLRANYKSERGYLDQIIYSMLKSEYKLSKNR